MPVADPALLMDLSCDLLAAAEACLVANGITVPDQVYVTPCQPDLICCSTLAVRQTDIGIIELDPPGKCQFRRQVHFEVWIARCVQVFTNEGNLPPLGSCAARAVGTVAGDATTILTDRWVILQCLLETLRALGPGSGWCCAPLSFVAVEPICEGGCAGTRFELTLTI